MILHIHDDDDDDVVPGVPSYSEHHISLSYLAILRNTLTYKVVQ